MRFPNRTGNPPDLADREAFTAQFGWTEPVGFSEFISDGVWNVDDVLRPIYEDTSKALGREFPYPADR